MFCCLSKSIMTVQTKHIRSFFNTWPRTTLSETKKGQWIYLTTTPPHGCLRIIGGRLSTQSRYNVSGTFPIHCFLVCFRSSVYVDTSTMVVHSLESPPLFTSKHTQTLVMLKEYPLPLCGDICSTKVEKWESFSFALIEIWCFFSIFCYGENPFYVKHNCLSLFWLILLVLSL